MTARNSTKKTSHCFLFRFLLKHFPPHEARIQLRRRRRRRRRVGRVKSTFSVKTIKESWNLSCCSFEICEGEKQSSSILASRRSMMIERVAVGVYGNCFLSTRFHYKCVNMKSIDFIMPFFAYNSFILCCRQLSLLFAY